MLSLRRAGMMLAMIAMVLMVGSSQAEPTPDPLQDAFPIVKAFGPEDPPVIDGGWMNPHKFPEMTEFADNCEQIKGEQGYEECRYDLCRLEHQMIGERWESACGSTDFRKAQDIEVWRAQARQNLVKDEVTPR